MTNLTFMQLKKLSRVDNSLLPQYKIAVMGDCATQHLAAAIRGYGVYTGLGLSVFDAEASLPQAAFASSSFPRKMISSFSQPSMER